MANNFEIQISLDDETLEKLSDQQLFLRGYKGVNTSLGGGVSTVWYQTNNFTPQVSVT